MKNYLIITLGTRDVQILKSKLIPNGWEIIGEANSKNFKITKNDLELDVTLNPVYPDYFLLSPRKSGEYILKNLSEILPIIELPLIQPLLNHLQEKNIQITNYLIIYTDQEQSFKEKKINISHFNNDTLYFKEIVLEILQNHMLLKNAQPDEYGIFEQVANIDFQYDHFAVSCKDLLLDNPDNIGEILLLPQGGIDQINHAITLQILQAFKHKVRLFQQPESSEPIELNFNKKFLNDLNKQKIQKHLDDYDFGAIDKNLHSNRTVYHLAQYAAKRLNLQYDTIEINANLLKNYNLPAYGHNDKEKLKDLYLSSKINYHQKKHTDFLWRVFTINELLFKIELSKVLGNTVDFFVKPQRDILTPWEIALNKIDTNLITIIESHKMPNGYPIDSRNPNRAAFKILFNEFVAKGLLTLSTQTAFLYQKVGDKLEALALGRNSIAHKLGSTDIKQINSTLSKTEPGYTSKNLFLDLDQLFNLQTPFGIYDQIKEEIEKLL